VPGRFVSGVIDWQRTAWVFGKGTGRRPLQPADAVVFIAGALQQRYLPQVNGTCPGNDMPTTDRAPRKAPGGAPRAWQGFVFGSVGAAGWVKYGHRCYLSPRVNALPFRAVDVMCRWEVAVLRPTRAE